MMRYIYKKAEPGIWYSAYWRKEVVMNPSGMLGMFTLTRNVTLCSGDYTICRFSRKTNIEIYPFINFCCQV